MRPGCTSSTVRTGRADFALRPLRTACNTKRVRRRAQRDVGHHQFTAHSELELIGGIERYRRHVVDATDLEAEQAADDRHAGVRLAEHRVTAAQRQQTQVDVHCAIDFDAIVVLEDTLVIDFIRDGGLDNAGQDDAHADECGVDVCLELHWFCPPGAGFWISSFGFAVMAGNSAG